MLKIPRTVVVILSAFLILQLGCSSGQVKDPSPPSPRLFDGMGTYHRPATTAVPLAQRFFDQGLVWLFAFNHDEAIRSFQQAAHLDSHFAMAWWGIALANGPHINNPLMPPERSAAAWKALQEAFRRKAGASPAEQALIDALAKRYAEVPPSNRKALDQAYAAAMRKAWKAYPNDADVGVLFAESLMDLRPWDLWTKAGKPQPETPEILKVLDRVIVLAPDHPGAHHLNIHAREASPHPELAIASADRLRQLVPISGHLVHMPSHIDVLTGNWEKATTSNIRAIAADDLYLQLSPRQDFYNIYMAHNHHMLAFAAMMEGQSQQSLRAARELVAGVPELYALANAPLVDGMMAIPYEVLMRFGRWDELLNEPAPPAHFPITTAMWRFTRSAAYAAKGELERAESERALFKKAAAAVPKDAMMMINPAKKVLAIADKVLDGELAYRKGEVSKAVTALRAGVKLEDQLRYMEPPEWIQPVRQTLGAILVASGRVEEAEKIYREDLKKWPENGWSLFGLSQCLEALGNIAEAEKTEARFRNSWARADTPIQSSCLCVARKPEA